MIDATTMQTLSATGSLESGGDSGASGFQAVLAAIEQPVDSVTSSSLSAADQAAVDRRSDSVAWTAGIGSDRSAPSQSGSQTGQATSSSAEGGRSAAAADGGGAASTADGEEAEVAEWAGASTDLSSGDEGADAGESGGSAGSQCAAAAEAELAQAAVSESSTPDSADDSTTTSALMLPADLSPTLANVVSSGASASALGVRISIDGLGSVIARARLRDGTLHLTLSTADPATATRLSDSLEQLRAVLSDQLGGARVEVQLGQSGLGAEGRDSTSERELSPEGGVSAANSADAAARQSHLEPALHRATIAHGTGIDLLV